MKKAIVILLTLLASNAYAGHVKIFDNHSSHTTPEYSTIVVDVRGAKTKTLQVTGVTALGNYSSNSGTVVAFCSTTDIAGPYVPCKTGATTIALADRGTYTWEDLSKYVKLQITRYATKLKTTAWLSWE